MVEIFVNNELVDSYGDVSAPLTFSIADISNPEKRNSSFSKSIKLPSTPTNDRVFTYIYEINGTVSSTDETTNYTPDFNPNLKTSCEVYIDSMLQFKGSIQLLQINNDKGKYEYELFLLGELKNIFLDWGEEELTDLDLSEYAHAWSYANIYNSWNDATIISSVDGSITTQANTGTYEIGTGYIYPLIDYGVNSAGNAVTNDPKVFQITAWRPAMYVKTIIDKMFSSKGYTYTSTFFDSERFKRLVIPSNKKQFQLTTEEKDDRKVKVAGEETEVFGVANFTTITWMSNNIPTYGTTDILSQWSDTTDKIIVSKTGAYKFRYSLAYKDGTSPFPNLISLNLAVYKNGVLLTTTNIASSTQDTAPTTSYYDNSYIADSGVCSLTAGDEIQIKYQLLGSATPSSYSLYIGAGASVEMLAQGDFDEGSTLYPEVFLPQKVKQKDFFKSILNMFNLYVEQTGEKTMNIVPRKDFYTSVGAVDWTLKLDHSKQIDIKPLGELGANEYLYTYKKDVDLYNEKYSKENNQEIYGEKLVKITNDFKVKQQKTEVIFSNSPIVGSSVNPWKYPRIVKENQNTGDYEPIDHNIRIMYYGGVVQMGASETYTITNSLGVSQATLSKYPYAGHLDNPYQPLFDLCFGKPREVYWSNAIYTDNNLYNIYHKRFIEEITDKDSKILTAYFRLTPLDIFDLDFRKYVFIDGAYYILQKISDYDFNRNEVTKVELLKIKNGTPYTETTIPVVWDGGVAVTDVETIEGGEDENRDLAADSEFTIVEGGEDEVRYSPADTDIIIVNGSGGADYTTSTILVP